MKMWTGFKEPESDGKYPAASSTATIPEARKGQGREGSRPQRKELYTEGH